MDIRYHPNPTALSATQRNLIANIAERGPEHVTHDAQLGWIPKIGAPDINSAGMRDNREYSPVPGPGITRIAAYGDSFTFGADVSLDESWTKRLAAISPQLEALNYGVGGYGLDQAYLRYVREGARYRPHLVFAGYVSENISRNVNVFRTFYTHRYPNSVIAKPRFQARDGKLVLVENPLPTLEDYGALLRNEAEGLARLGTHDFHYQINYRRGSLDFSPAIRLAKVAAWKVNEKLVHPIFQLGGMYDVNSEAYDVTVRIFDAFYRSILEKGALPVILVFPDLNDQKRNRQGKPRRYAPLLENFRAKGYRHIDLLDAIEPHESRLEIKDLTRSFGHYSPAGNEIVATYIHKELKRLGFLDPARIKEAAERERLRLGVGVQ